jgi:RNA polymerase sigma factor (sigma-70 family)
MDDALALYRSAHLNHPLLTHADETCLLRKAQAGDSKALADLVSSNQRLVMSVAVRFFHSGMSGDLDLMDLVQYGNEGLLQAVRRWDQRRSDLRFSTYATWWIRAVIRRNILQRGGTIGRTARQGEQITTICRARSDLYVRLHRTPRPAEIANETGLSLRLVESLLPIIPPPLSLDHDPQPDSGLSLADTIRGHDDTARTAERNLNNRRLERAISDLPLNYASVLRYRYGLFGSEVLSYAEIGRKLKVSRTRVQEIERTALERLRRALADF